MYIDGKIACGGVVEDNTQRIDELGMGEKDRDQERLAI